ncbi:FecR family protein [Mucilaginibacter calamicampi]|uniref:FecR family protein n=1 Tax=Mucilaginibacter calamicampi TaxID=1302352 RepID=A0ABW2Z1B0_9SPHI
MPDKDITQLLDQESFLNYCFGRSDSDVRYWTKWIADHPDEAMQVEELKRTVIMMAKASQVALRDKHFEELQQKIAGSPVIVPMRKKTFRISVWSAAAAVLIIAGAALLFYAEKQPEQNNVLALKKEIKPGGNKAILTLANGQKISLSDSDNGQIAMQSSIKITKTAEGEIVYETPVGLIENSEAKPEYNTIEAPVGGQWQVILPDRSKVWLNAKSSLTYPTFFTGNERKVQLKGEAYFEIAHNENMPFKVAGKTQTVEVLGTHFDIMAYEDEQIARTTLLEGSVKIADSGKSRVLVPGEQALVGHGAIRVTNNIDLEDVMAWKNGYFKFNESLESIMRKIARWYDVQVVYAGNVDPSIKFGGKISRYKNLSSALKIMELTGNVHFIVEGRRVTVMQ